MHYKWALNIDDPTDRYGLDEKSEDDGWEDAKIRYPNALVEGNDLQILACAKATNLCHEFDETEEEYFTDDWNEFLIIYSHGYSRGYERYVNDHRAEEEFLRRNREVSIKKLAFIDVDGVCLDNSYREERANEDVKEMMKGVPKDLDPKLLEDLRKACFYHEQAFYNQDLLMTDTQIPEAYDKLKDLSKQGWHIIYITSLPEKYVDVRASILVEYLISGSLICKPEAYKYVKTAQWKATEIRRMAEALEATDILFVDDEEGNRDAVANDSLKGDYHLFVYESLDVIDLK